MTDPLPCKIEWHDVDGVAEARCNQCGGSSRFTDPIECPYAPPRNYSPETTKPISVYIGQALLLFGIAAIIWAFGMWK